MLAWNKGAYRGWCIAAVEETSSDWVDLITDYGRKYIWGQRQIVEAIARGEFFYHEPHEVLRFMAMQFMRVPDLEGVRDVIKDLHDLADRLESIKTHTQKGGDANGRTNARLDDAPMD
jgi:hypothetical protein